jgi:hypothetical protein
MARTPRWVALVGVLTIVGACGFPDVQYAEDGGDDGAAAGEAGGADMRGDAAAADPEGAADVVAFDVGPDVELEGAGADAPQGGDASDVTTSDVTTSDVTTIGESGMEASTDAPSEAQDEAGRDAAPDGASDEDVHEAGVDAPPVCDFDLDTFLATGATCGGNDCCDTDKKAHPGVTAFFVQPDDCGSFDYDCNGKDDPQYPISLSCGGTGATGCTGGSGFLSDPGCGNTGPYYTCVANGLLACKPGSPITLTQGCN